MTLSQRRRRAVYRVCSEEEYLAGADLFADWNAAPAVEPKHGHGLHRVAGVAALTGAVGTVGGVIGLAGLHARAGDRTEIAERAAPSTRIAVAPVHASTEHAMLRPRVRWSPSSPRRGHTRPAVRSVQVALAPRRSEMRPAVQTPAPSPVTSAAQATRATVMSAAQSESEPAASTARSAPAAQAASAPRAQSEFGFEH